MNNSCSFFYLLTSVKSCFINGFCFQKQNKLKRENTQPLSLAIMNIILLVFLSFLRNGQQWFLNV